jgi:hypothetical protein
MSEQLFLQRTSRDGINLILDCVAKAEDVLAIARNNQEPLVPTLTKYINDFHDLAQGKPVRIESTYLDHLRNFASTSFNRIAPASNAGFFELMPALNYTEVVTTEPVRLEIV